MWPSMMCADFANLAAEVTALEEAKVSGFHIDFMDGVFVPNFGMGLQDFETIRNLTTLPVDVHLMIKNPTEYIEKFANLGADIIYFHPEIDIHPARTIDKIKQFGKKAGIAINPGTSIETIKELLAIIDNVMVMTVNPGFAGQKYLEYTTDKIKQINRYKEKNDYQYQIFVDGAISPNKITELSALGVEGFILGTSALFGKEESYTNLIKKLKD